jgi:hypothetical protein
MAGKICGQAKPTRTLTSAPKSQPVNANASDFENFMTLFAFYIGGREVSS